jgi:hypothetical protein
MANRPISNPRYWRDLAERARLQAADMKDHESMLILVGIADAYERLAKRAEASGSRCALRSMIPSFVPGSN